MKHLLLLFSFWLALVSGLYSQNNSLHFDGVDDYVKLSVLPSTIEFAKGFSFTAWVKWDAFQGNARLFDFANGKESSNNLILRIDNSTGRIAFQAIKSNTTNSEFIADNEVVCVGKWVHVAVTLYINSATIYINGKQVKTGTIIPPYSVDRNCSYLGKSAWDADKYFKGSMDEVTIWSKTLSQSEVVAAMRGVFSKSDDKLMAYYDCNQGVANGNNTTITTLNSTASSSLNISGTLNNFDLTNGNTSSNFVDGYNTSDVATILTAPSSITLLNSTSDSKQLGITSNATWSISGVPSWLNLSSTSGNGNASLTVSPKSVTVSPRSATLTLTAPGATAQNITITQIKEANITLTAAPTTFAFGYAANGTGTFSITSNTSWSITGIPSWLSLSASSGSNNASVTITAIQTNTSTSSRSATLKLSAAEASDVSITVTQEKNTTTFSVSPTSSAVAAAGGTFDITVQTNISWSAISPTWIALNKSSGNSDIQFAAIVSANPFPYSRVGSITFTASPSEDRVVSVSQEAGVASITGIAPMVGDGSANNPYEISTLSQLYWIAENSNRWAYHYIQTADIDASASATWFNSMGWPSIGNEVTPFSGTYNGQGHTISGIAINHPSESLVGFFGSNNGIIKMLGLANATIAGGSSVGKMVGNNSGTIENCFATGSITGGMQSGGFVGSNSGIIKNCYSIGSVTAGSFSGGFVGIVNSSGNIQNCYSIGNFSGSGLSYGAFVGQEFSGSITNCHWNTGSEQGGAGSYSGTFTGTYLSSDDMKIQSKFTGWDFVGETNNGLDNIWAIATSMNNGYPILTSQIASPVVATISNVTATNITYTSATVSSRITSLGIPNPTRYGFCWSSDSDEPTINSNNIDLGIVNGNQSAPIALTYSFKNLSPDKTYRIRAYATNMAGTIYSETLIINAHSPAFTFASNASGSLRFSMKCSSNGGNYSINWGNGTAVEGTKSDQSTVYSTTAYKSGSTVLVYADGVTGLDFGNQSLTSIDVSNCTLLTNLIVSSNNLSQLDVRNNNELVSLNCNYNNINALDVKSNTKLITFRCNNNNLTILDVSANTLLKEFFCCDNKLTSLDLTNNKKIEKLYCFNNTLSSLNVTGCTALLGISAFNNQLKSIDVSTNTSMVALWINENRFTIASLPQDKAIYHSMTSLSADYTYNYAPQQPIAVSSNNGIVDLSSQLNAKDINGVEQTTVYQWYLIDGTPLSSTNYIENNGVFTFTKTIADEVYCKMSNAAFPNLIDNNALRTVSLKVIVAVEPLISWGNPADITYGTALSNTQLNATATYNGNTVDGIFTYNPAIGSILNSGNAQELKATFTPTDLVNYTSSTKTVTINVAKAMPSIGWNIPADITYGTTLSAAQLNATANVPGSFSYSPAAGTVLNAGEGQALSVTFTPDDAVNYSSASKSVTINVAKAMPSISWNVPADITYGTTLSAAQLNATANVPGSFSYSPAAGTVLNAGEGQALSVTFTPDDAANYLVASKSVTINVDKASLTVTANDQSIKIGEAIPALTLSYAGFKSGDTESVLNTKPTATTNATATSPAGTYDINVSDGDDNNYAFTYVAGTLTITSSTDIDDVADAGVAVYPNPFTDNLTITVDGDCNGRYTVTSLVGATVEQGIVEGGKATLSLSHLKQGIYILSVAANGKVQTVKVMKQ